MDYDLLGSVARIADQLRQSQALLRHLQARAREVREGADESGTITVVIDDEGTARDVRVATAWRRRLAPVHVGAAVIAADADAANRRAAATVGAFASGVATQDGS